MKLITNVFLVVCIALVSSCKEKPKENAENTEDIKNQAPAQVRYVNAKPSLRVYEKANSKSQLIAELGYGLKVKLIDTITVKNVNWAKVAPYQGEGYVLEASLSNTPVKIQGEPMIEKNILGFWKTQDYCGKGQKSGIKIRADKTFITYLFTGAESDECDVEKQKGTWQIKDNQICFDFLDKELDPGCYWLMGKKLVTNRDKAGSFLENFSNDVLTGMSK